MSSAHTPGRPNAADRCDTFTCRSFEMSNAPVTRFMRSPPVKKPLRLRGDGLHAREQPVAHFRIARALPFGEPGAGERTPVRAETQVREIAFRIVDLARFGARQFAGRAARCAACAPLRSARA